MRVKRLKRIERITHKWNEGQALTACERRQIRKYVKAPKSILGPSRRVTCDQLPGRYTPVPKGWRD